MAGYMGRTSLNTSFDKDYEDKNAPNVCMAIGSVLCADGPLGWSMFPGTRDRNPVVRHTGEVCAQYAYRIDPEKAALIDWNIRHTVLRTVDRSMSYSLCTSIGMRRWIRQLRKPQ